MTNPIIRFQCKVCGQEYTKYLSDLPKAKDYETVCDVCKSNQ